MPWRTLAVVLASAALRCSLIAEAELKSGIGDDCARNADCQQPLCEEGKCTKVCAADSDCPRRSVCLTERCRVGCRVDADCAAAELCASNSCTPALRVGAILPGLSNGEDGWSTSHKIGLDDATSALAYPRFGDVPYALRDGLRSADDVRKAIDQYVSQGADVIITASSTASDQVLAEAPKHPSVKFIAAGATSNGGLPNVGAYRGKSEQAWYVAGQLSARVADRGARRCIGVVLSTPSKEIVRQTNAFVRGARFQQPDIKIVIRWMGAGRDFAETPGLSYKAKNFEFDSAFGGKLFREELLTAQLADLGCTLIAHRTETQRVVVAVEKRFAVPVKNGAFNHDLFSLGVDARDACRADVKSGGEWLTSCLGAVYWNWGGVYKRFFDEIHRNTWSALVEAEAFHVDADGLSQFILSDKSSVTSIEPSAAPNALRAAADKGFGAVFQGPYAFNGQRDLDRDGHPDADQSVASGQLLSDDELERMCWFVEGTYELPDPNVVQYETVAPALVPYGPAVAGGTSTLDGADPSARKKYGDVIDYVKSIGQDPTEAMSCALH